MIDSYIKTYGRRLYGLCITLCPNREDADDLYQETWLKAVSRMDTFDSSKEFGPWLTKICVNSYRNLLRKYRRSPIYNGFQSTEEKERIFENTACGEIEDYSDLHAAVDRLPDKLRTAVILFYFQDRNIQSVGQILGVPEGTVKSRLNRAKKLLKEALADETAVQF